MRTRTSDQRKDLADALNEARDPREEKGEWPWNGEHDHAATIRALGELGLRYEQTEAVVEELNDLGGHCDGEVMLNVIRPS
jgi:hypothetical protein